MNMEKQLLVTNDALLLELLKQRAKQARLWILDMISVANSSHIGSAYSIVDILVTLYSQFDIDSIAKQVYPRDIFMLSKGHAAAALYAAQATVGLIPVEALKTFYKDNSVLAGHPIRHAFPGIEASTGSLGHALSLGVGMALALKKDGHPNKVFVLLGDGECQEGSIWEALAMATRFHLDNLVIYIDYNNLQGLDQTEDITGKDLSKRLAAFGAKVQEIDGHNYSEILQSMNNCVLGVPNAIIAHTIKGKGVPFMENKLEWHYKCPRGDLYEQAKKALGES